eukprot:1182987-Prorocentrum_minimum.AAC.4
MRRYLGCATPPCWVVGFVVLFVGMQCVMLRSLQTAILPGQNTSQDLNEELRAEIDRLRGEFATLAGERDGMPKETRGSRKMIENPEQITSPHAKPDSTKQKADKVQTNLKQRV